MYLIARALEVYIITQRNYKQILMMDFGEERYQLVACLDKL